LDRTHENFTILKPATGGGDQIPESPFLIIKKEIADFTQRPVDTIDL
jgi:hypothetical protein